jgi:hypothetical protein
MLDFWIDLIVIPFLLFLALLYREPRAVWWPQKRPIAHETPGGAEHRAKSSALA